MKAVIIEDMPLARSSLKADLKELCPEIELIGEAEGVISGLKLIKKTNPELIFLDVDLSDGNAFDLLDIAGEISARIIFTTASDKHAIKAFEVSAIDYLMKPIEEERLVEAVNKAKQFGIQSEEQLNLLKNTIEGTDSKSKIALHTQDQIRIVAIDEITRVEASGNYSIIYLKDKSKMLVSKTLKEYDRILEPKGFFRTHQSHLVNLKYIKAFIKTEGGYLLMKDENHVPVSVRKRTGLFAVLENL